MGYSDTKTRQKISGEVVIPPTHSHMLQNAAGDYSLKRRLPPCIQMKVSSRGLFGTCALLSDHPPHPAKETREGKCLLLFCETIVKFPRRVKVDYFQT